MTNYREILRLLSLGISSRDIAKSVPCSRNTVASVSERAREAGLSWPLPPDLTDRELEKLLYSYLMMADCMKTGERVLACSPVFEVWTFAR